MKKSTRVLLILTVVFAVSSIFLGSFLVAEKIKHKTEPTAPFDLTHQEMLDNFCNKLHNIRYYMEIPDVRDICKEQDVVSVYRYTHNGAFS